MRFYTRLAIAALLSWPSMPHAQTLVGDLPISCSTDFEKAAKAYNAGFKAEHLDDIETAITLYNEAIKIDPAYCDAMDNLGRLYRTQKRYDKAEALYKRSIELDGENPVARMNLGTLYSLQGKYEEAIEQFRYTIKVVPDDPEGYYGVGVLYMKINRTKEAIFYLERSEELYAKNSSPHIDDARSLLSIANAQIDKCEEALDWAKKLASTSRKQEIYRTIQSSCPFIH